MAILELNMDQELGSVYQDPLLLFLLDLQKAHNTVDRGLLLTNLEGYGTGPYMCRLLEIFWFQHKVVTCQNQYQRPHFNSTRRTNQGGLVLNTLFNLIVYNVVHNWLALTV